MNLKTSILGLVALCLSLMSNAQAFKADTLLATNVNYVSSISESPNKHYICYSIGSQATVLMDSQFRELTRFTYDHLWGGGGIVFSHDSKYLAYKVYNEVDTVVIYNLETKSETRVCTDVSGLLFLANSHQLLISHNGNFKIYDIDTKKLSNTLFSVGSKKNEFFATYTEDATSQKLYVSTTKHTLDVYNTSSWEKEKSYGPFADELDNLTLCDSHLVFSIGDKIFSLNLSDGESRSTLAGNFTYLSGIALSKEAGQVLIYGNSSTVYTMDVATMNCTAILTDLSKNASYGLYPLSSQRILVGNYGDLWLYRKSEE